MNVVVEILNRESENYTVIDLSDCWPKVSINATFANQSFELEEHIMYHATVMYYDYRPGITWEYHKFDFYINQSDLSQLPDGNYTLFRPINTASSLGWVEPAEILLTKIEVNTGKIAIFYPEFVVFTIIPELNKIMTTAITFGVIILWGIWLRKRKKNEALS